MKKRIGSKITKDKRKKVVKTEWDPDRQVRARVFSDGSAVLTFYGRLNEELIAGAKARRMTPRKFLIAALRARLEKYVLPRGATSARKAVVA